MYSNKYYYLKFNKLKTKRDSKIDKWLNLIQLNVIFFFDFTFDVMANISNLIQILRPNVSTFLVCNKFKLIKRVKR